MKNSTHAYDYLSKKLKPICQNGSTTEKCDYNCMENASTQSPHNTDMPASLDDEPKEVKGRCKCPPPPPKPKPTAGGVARILPPADRTGDLPDSDNSDEEIEETAKEALPDETEVVEETVAEDTVEDGEGETAKRPPQPQEPQGPTTTDTTTPLDVCDTVKSALTSGKLDEACKQKYSGNNSRLGWKCVSTSGVSTATSSEGSDTTTRSSGDTGSSGDTSERVRGKRSADGAPGKSGGDKDGATCIPPRRRRLYVGKLETLDEGAKQDDLRTAFIKCAAVETFFSWHEYKMDNNDGDAEDKLKKGEIPEEFKRQMFYTLGDYRDLCVGVKDDDVIKALKDSGDNKSGDKNIKDISDKIKEMLKKQSSPPNGGHPNSDKDPKHWWNENAKHIWEGMLFALCYDSTSKIMNTDVHTKLTSDPNNNYTTVTFEGGFNSDKSATITTTTTKLDTFVKRPTFFRWLEEWAREFCRKRKDKLEKIENECRGEFKVI